MPASTKNKPSLLDRLTGKRSTADKAERSALSAKLALRREEMRNAVRYRLYDLALSLATEQPVSVEESAAIMAEAGVDQGELDRMVAMIRNRAKRDTYRSIGDDSFEAFRRARREVQEHKQAKEEAIKQFDKRIEQAEADAHRFHADSRKFRALADEADREIPLVEEIVDSVREENRRLRNSVASAEDQLAAAVKLAEGAADPVSAHLAEFAGYIARSNDGRTVENRTELLAAVFEDLKPKGLADCTLARVEAWGREDWSATAIAKAKREARIFLSWCYQQGHIDVDLGKGDSPSGVDHSKRIGDLQASVDAAKADLAASDELLAEVEAEAEKPIPFQSLRA